MADEKITLGLDVSQAVSSAQQLEDELRRVFLGAKKVAVATQEVTDNIDLLVRETSTYTVSAKREEQELDKLTRAAMEATQSHRLMSQMLDDVPAHTAVATAAVGKLAGEKNNRGYGLMGVNYAAQDFITVVSMGGGWGRAMMSMANNVTPVVMNLGLGAGLAGVIGTVVTVASMGVSAIEKWWNSVDSDKADSAKDKLKEIEDQAKKTNDAFKKLTEAPTDYEKMAAEGFGLALGGKAGKQAAAEVARVIPRDTVIQGMTGAQHMAFARAQAEGGRTDEDLRKQAFADETRATGGEGAPDAFAVQLRFEALKQRRDTAKTQAERSIAEGEQQMARRMVTQATEATPEGARARAQLTGMIGGREGFGGLAGMMPGALKAADEAFEADEGPGTEAFGERLHKAGIKRRKAATDAAKRAARDEHAMDAYLKQIGAETRRVMGKDEQQFHREQRANAAEGERRAKAAARAAAKNRKQFGPARGKFDMHAAAQRLKQEKAQGQELLKAQQELGQAMMGGTATTAEQIRLLRSQTQQLRTMQQRAMQGMENTPMSTGMPR